MQGSGTFSDGEKCAEYFRRHTHKPENAKTIAFIAPAINGYYVSEIFKSVAANAPNCNFFADISENNAKKEELLINKYVNAQVDGILLYPSDFHKYSETILNLQLKKYPIVLIDRELEGLSLDLVTSDNFESGYACGKYLIDKGHKEIAVASCLNPNISACRARVEGCTKALSDHDMIPSYVFNNPGQLKKLADMTSLTAIVGIDPHSYLHIAAAIQNLGLNGKIDIISIGLSESDFLYNEKNVTFIKQDTAGIGKAAIELLILRINNPNRPVQTVYVKSQMISL